MGSQSPDAAGAALRERLHRRSWRLLLDPPGRGAWNMAVDAALFATARQGGAPALRFYTWQPPALSLGRFQPATEGIRWQALGERGWEAVRRPTGGRAVLHQHELTYSITLPPDVVGSLGPRSCYAVLRAGLAQAISRCLALDFSHSPSLPLGHSPHSEIRHPISDIPYSPPANCFARVGPGDIAVAAGKVVGSAQAHAGGALLQHGSILLDVDPCAWHDLFGAAGALAPLRDLTGAAAEPTTLARDLAEALAHHWDLSLTEERLTADENARALRTTADFALERDALPTEL